MINISLLASSIENLFSNYTGAEIIIFIFLIAMAVKEGITLIDWFKNRGKTKFQAQESIEKQSAQIQEILDIQNQRTEEMQEMKRCIQMLITSDKNDIKAWIIERYHQVMTKGWIDDYELDCLERRYSDYKQEGGNSYIEDLMEDIRKLPKTSRANP